MEQIVFWAIWAALAVFMGYFYLHHAHGIRSFLRGTGTGLVALLLLHELGGLFIREAMDYIIPPMPPPGIAGIAGASDFFSANTHSVVRNIEAIEAAFSNATRETLVGSMIPALSRSS